MRTASCLTLIAIGAIFTFAVTAHPSFLNLQIAGVVIMATGVAGLGLAPVQEAPQADPERQQVLVVVAGHGPETNLAWP